MINKIVFRKVLCFFYTLLAVWNGQTHPTHSLMRDVRMKHIPPAADILKSN